MTAIPPLSNIDRKREYWLNDFQLLAKQRVYLANDSMDAGRGQVLETIHLLPNDIVTAVWPNVIEAAPDNSTIDLGYGSVVNYWDNGLSIDTVGFSSPILTATDTWNFDQIHQGQSDTIEIEVPGAVLGDIVTVIPDSYQNELQLTGTIIYDERVEVQVANFTPDLILNPASTVFTVIVNKAPLAPQPVAFGSRDTIDIKATTDIADVDINSGVIDIMALIIRI